MVMNMELAIVDFTEGNVRIMIIHTVIKHTMGSILMIYVQSLKQMVQKH